MVKYCSKCGKESDDSDKFCKNCGEAFSPNITFSKNRNLELVLGILGGIFGLFFSLFVIITYHIINCYIFGSCGVILSIIGIISSVYVKYNALISGMVLIIVSLLFLPLGPLMGFGSFTFGIFPAFFFIIAGICAIARTN